MDIKIARNRARSGRVVLILLAVVLFGLLAVQACTAASASVVSVGEPAPDFTLVDLDGNQVSLSDFRGETVFINFWATWCAPCRAEMPEMEAVYQEYKDKGLVVIGVDIRETKEQVLQYIQEGGYSWIFVLDATGEVTTNYRVTGIPTSFFIDREGIIQAVNVGAMTKRAMETNLATAMK